MPEGSGSGRGRNRAIATVLPEMVSCPPSLCLCAAFSLEFPPLAAVWLQSSGKGRELPAQDAPSHPHEQLNKTVTGLFPKEGPEVK